MKWLRRILMSFSITAVFLVISGTIGYHEYRAVPDWYIETPMSDADQKIAANSADQKLADMFSWAAGVQAFNARSLRGNPGQSPDNSKTITLSDQELYAFLNAWNNPTLNDLEGRLSQDFTDPRVALTDGKIIFAGKSLKLGVIISATLEPSVDDSGKFHLQWDGISAGKLTIPRIAFAGRLGDFNSQLQDQLQRYQQSAQIDQTLNANSSASQACATRWLLDAVNGQPSDPTAFVPFDVGEFQNAEAVKLTNIQISGGSIAITVQTLPPTDREAVLSQLKQPYSTQ
jgi:hypothetical protein